MSYQVLARKWRPPRFSDVVGQEIITRTLANAIRSERIAHAFLFSGVRGVGKTTTARILAKSLNCIQGPTVEPCDECDSCREIAASTCIDVLEIDAASNTGVDSIREIRDSVRYGTARDRLKIFIIDEVHMLSTAAFNALLKTLEEPPPHVKFIMATTELQKIPVTIRSRCQHFEFKPIPLGLILDRLQLICQQEGVHISDYALRWVAEAGRGSMRDAQSTLDQIIALAGSEVNDEDVRSILGVVDETVLEEISAALLDQDATRLLETLEELTRSGVEAHSFCRKLIGHFRNLLVCKVAGWNEKLIHVPETHKEALERLAGAFSELDLIRFYDTLNTTEEELRQHPRPHTHLEIALVKLIELARLPELEAVITQLKGGPAPVTGGGPASPRPARGGGSHSPQSRPASAPRPVPSSQALPPTNEGEQSPGPSSPDPPATNPSGSGTVAELMDLLQKNQEAMLFNSLQHARLVQWEADQLGITFAAEENFHASIIDQPDQRRVLAETCAKISGSETVKVLVRREEHQEAGASRPDPLQDPAVRTFMNAFPGKHIVEHHRKD